MAHPPSAEGVDHDSLPFAEKMALYDAGERLYLRCGHQTLVAEEVLRRQGIRSRHVSTLSKTGVPWTDGEGHALLEVWIGKRWVVYDPDANRQMLDLKGRPINIVEAVRQRPFNYRQTSTDSYQEAEPYTYAQLDAALNHAMGIPFIQMKNGYFAYHLKSKQLRRRVKSYRYHAWVHVGEERWRSLVGVVVASEGE